MPRGHVLDFLTFFLHNSLVEDSAKICPNLVSSVSETNINICKGSPIIKHADPIWALLIRVAIREKKRDYVGKIPKLRGGV